MLITAPLPKHHRPDPARGFTIVELLIVVAIVGILSMIAYPSYQESIRKGKRSDGEALLLEMAARLGRSLYTNGAYSTDLTAVGYLSASNVSSNEGYYAGSVLAVTVDCSINTCYVLRATPQGGQAQDGIMELTSTGIKRRDKDNDGDPTETGENSWD